jgi:hypothetical protein
MTRKGSQVRVLYGPLQSCIRTSGPATLTVSNDQAPTIGCLDSPSLVAQQPALRSQELPRSCLREIHAPPCRRTWGHLLDARKELLKCALLPCLIRSSSRWTRPVLLSSGLASAIQRAYCLRCETARLANAAFAVSSPLSAAFRAGGASTSRGASSSSITTSTWTGPGQGHNRKTTNTTRAHRPRRPYSPWSCRS